MAEEIETSNAVDWADFIANYPPGKMRSVLNASELNGNRLVATHPEILLYCDSESCNGEHYFDRTLGNPVYIQGGANFFWRYVCRHCKKSAKTYALFLKIEEGAQECKAYKYGESPTFGPHIPTRLFSILGTDQEYFFKGRQAEAAGLGIGSFAYYRRVVENQKGRILDEILKVFDRIGGPKENRELIIKARAETQFSKAVDMVKDAIPESLKIDGHSPLTLLHTALSEGLHEKNDEACLELASSIRLVLSELAERIRTALLEHKELTGAVAKLLNRNKPPK